MKRVGKILLIIVIGLIVVLFGMYGLLMYKLHYEVKIIDISKSPNSKYTLYLQSVGSPVFFSSADGQLVLKEGKKEIATHKLVLSDDGGSVRKSIWKVSWKEDYVNVIISGSEQDDERIKIGFDGKSESEWLQTRWGKYTNVEEKVPEQNPSESYEAPVDKEIQLEQQLIMEGYKSIYDSVFKEQNASFIEDYNAKGNSRILLYEDDSVVRYMVYDRKSANKKCGLYVYFSREKNADGSWGAVETILDMYAYVYDTGDVVSSGKTHWADVATDAYREVTGEP